MLAVANFMMIFVVPSQAERSCPEREISVARAYRGGWTHMRVARHEICALVATSSTVNVDSPVPHVPSSAVEWASESLRAKLVGGGIVHCGRLWLPVPCSRMITGISGGGEHL